MDNVGFDDMLKFAGEISLREVAIAELKSENISLSTQCEAMREQLSEAERQLGATHGFSGNYVEGLRLNTDKVRAFVERLDNPHDIAFLKMFLSCTLDTWEKDNMRQMLDEMCQLPDRRTAIGDMHVYGDYIENQTNRNI